MILSRSYGIRIAIVDSLIAVSSIWRQGPIPPMKIIQIKLEVNFLAFDRHTDTITSEV